jgi:hypothetical protein
MIDTRDANNGRKVSDLSLKLESIYTRHMKKAWDLLKDEWYIG